MPQVSEQHSSVRQNDAISNSLQLGLQTLGNNLIAKREEKQKQNAAANKYAEAMRTRPDLFREGAAVDITDGVVNMNQIMEQDQGRLFGKHDKTQTADSKAPQMISDTNQGRDLVKEAAAWQAKQDADPAKIAAKNAMISTANMISSGGVNASVGTSTNTNTTPTQPTQPTGTNLPTNSAIGGLAALINSATNAAATAANTQPTVSSTAPQTTPVSSTPTAGVQKTGSGSKTKESASIAYKGGVLDLNGEEHSRLTMLENREAIEDEVKTSIGNLSALAMLTEASNAATGDKGNQYEALRQYREKFISEIQGKVGYKQSTIEQKYKTGGIKMNEPDYTARQGAETQINNYSSTSIGGGGGAVADEAGDIRDINGLAITGYMSKKKPGYVYYTSEDYAIPPTDSFINDFNSGLVNFGGKDKKGTPKEGRQEAWYRGHPIIIALDKQLNPIVISPRKHYDYPNGVLQTGMGLGLNAAKAQTTGALKTK